mmetsp:Transcript_33475/g.104358  ORF Transcript_33475/g.104358 Transcript_33475/m.104358 type:complete len:240 (+) Transcript_33475:81-800(+)
MLIQPSTPRPFKARADTFTRRLFRAPNCRMETFVPGFRTAFASLSRASATRTVSSEVTWCCPPTSKLSRRNCMSEPHLITKTSLALSLVLIQPWAWSLHRILTRPASPSSTTLKAVPTCSSEIVSLSRPTSLCSGRRAAVSPWSPTANSTFCLAELNVMPPRGAPSRFFIASLAVDILEAKLKRDDVDVMLPLLAVSHLSGSPSPAPGPPAALVEDELLKPRLTFEVRLEKLPFRARFG